MSYCRWSSMNWMCNVYVHEDVNGGWTTHVAGKTMTVGELREFLCKYTKDTPVLAEWEGVRAYIEPEMFSVERVSKGMEADACDCLVVDVNIY